MKKSVTFLAGMSIMLFAGCSNGSKPHAEETDEDSMPCCPPLGYVIEIQPLGAFSQEKAEQLRNEFVTQLATIVGTMARIPST